MASKDEAEPRRRRPSVKSTVALFILVILVILSAWSLVTVSKISQIPPSTFVTLPTTPLSSHGQVVMLVSINTITKKGVAAGVSGSLDTISGQPVAGAQIYVQYYLNGAYHTQVATTGQDGSFEIYFPMNWTGSLPVTFTYFGDAQHQGLSFNSSLPGEGL